VSRFVGFDTETHLIKQGLLTPRLVCISFAERIEEKIVTRLLHRQGDGAYECIKELILDDDVTLIAHNHNFDWGVILAVWPDLLPLLFRKLGLGLVYDTLNAQKLLDITNGELQFHDDARGKRVPSRYTLAALVLRHFIEVVAKADTYRLKYALYDNTPVKEWAQEARDYAIADAVWALRLHERQMEIAGETIPTSTLQFCAHFALHLASIWGLRTDAVATAALKERLTIERNIAHAKLASTDIYKTVLRGKYKGKISKNMAAIKRRVEAGFKKRNMDVPKTAKLAIATSKEVLLESLDPDLKILADVAESDKLLTSFIPVLEAGTRVPVTPEYGLVESGRTSCRNPNVQQLPRKGGVRECFISTQPWVFSFVDFSGVELCTLAQTLLDLFDGHSVMADQLKAGRDLHLFFGAAILNISYEEAKALMKAGDPAIKEARQFAKILNFGACGGLGAKSLVEYAKGSNVVMTRQKAESLLGQWMATFPEMVLYFDHIRILTENGNARITHGRSGFVRGDVSFTATANSYFQELAAFGGKRALWALAKEEYAVPESPLYGSRTVAWIHDESVLAVPYDPRRPELAAAAAHRQALVMREAMQTACPDIPIKAEPTLCRRWYKNAEAVFVDGLLVPCKPKIVDGYTTWVADL
jgi:DNA polymerase-1